MSNKVHLADYHSTEEKADFDKFCILKKMNRAKLGHSIITCWMDEQYDKFSANGVDIKKLDVNLEEAYKILEDK